MYVLCWYFLFVVLSNFWLNIINGNIIDVILKYDVIDNVNKDELRIVIDVDKIVVIRGKKKNNIIFILFCCVIFFMCFE